jgi:hypothetical protein
MTPEELEAELDRLGSLLRHRPKLMTEVEVLTAQRDYNAALYERELMRNANLEAELDKKELERWNWEQAARARKLELDELRELLGVAEDERPFFAVESLLSERQAFKARVEGFKADGRAYRQILREVGKTVGTDYPALAERVFTVLANIERHEPDEALKEKTDG